MKHDAIDKQLPGLRFKPNKWTLAFVEEFHIYDKESLVLSIGYDGIKDNVSARLRPSEARALAKWILSLVGDGE
jgi:hypothetical protein